MAKKKQIRNVLCFLVMIVILMSVMPVSVLAVNDSDNTTGVSNTLNELENAFTKIYPVGAGDNSSGDCAPVPDADLPEIYLNDTQECVLSSDSGNDTNIIILTDVSDGTRETVSALGCDVYVKIDDPCCVGYRVYVDGAYKFTEGGDGTTPDGFCAFYVCAGTHTIKITKNGRSASKTKNFQCGYTYRWTSMPNCWCEDGGGSDDCKYPPTVKFDKTKYYEGNTVHATVSTSQSSVNYKIKDCGGTVRKSGTTSNGKKISYTIPKGASKCCYWQICFYWNEGDDLASGMSYDCTKCYNFYVCPVQTCEVYVKIEDPCCVGYRVYVDNVYQFTEGGDGTTPDGFCAFHVKEGTHTLKITKNGRSASKTINFQCNIVYRWVSMPKNWCGDGEAYVEIKDKYCKGYQVYVDGKYKLTEGRTGTPDGNCGFFVGEGTHTIEIRKNGRSASLNKYFDCSYRYTWVSMPDYWCDPCYDPPIVTFDNPPDYQGDKPKYSGGDKLSATVSTSQSSVYYEIKDCGGTVLTNGYTSNAGKISYTIPTSVPTCCYWTICFYWSGDGGGWLAGGQDPAQYYDCIECYTFYVCPDPCYDPPIVTFINPPDYEGDKPKYSEGNTVHATVSSSHGSVYYAIKDCNGKVQTTGSAGDGDSISYLIPSGELSDCCYWTICFYWGGNGDWLTTGVDPAQYYDCIICYTFEVCPICTANVKIDDDTCVGYNVYVDDVYQLTEGVGEPLDGYCAFGVIEGVHNIEIRDNECFASIRRYFECGSTYLWATMSDNWCKCKNCPSEVRFEGTAKTDELAGLVCYKTYYCEVIADRILYDPDNTLKVGNEYTVGYGDEPKNITAGDKIVVNGTYYHNCGPFGAYGRICGDLWKDLPDLIIENIKWPSGTVCLGDLIPITVTVKNIGGEKANQSVVKYYVGNNYIDRDIVPSLVPNATSNQSFNWTANSCGNISVMAIADANHTVHECNENNNDKQKRIEASGPDLITHIWPMGATGTVCLGEPITFTVTVINTGDCTAGQSVVKYYAGGEYVDSELIPSLGPGASSTQTFTWTASSCGNVSVRAVADANHNVRECDENNNEKAKSVKVDGPDLIIQDITLPSGKICLGQPVTITVTVKNEGGCTAGASTVKYFVDNKYVDSDSIPSLDPGAASSQTFTWTASSCGNVSVKGVADANNEVHECDENNNENQKSIEVDGPDLLISDITLPSGKICLGEPVTITVTVKNQGGCTAGVSTVKYFVDNKYVDSDSIPSLDPGAASTQTFTWTADSCGNVSVRALADANNEVHECDENNNEKQKNIEVDGPDLIISDITVPDETICLDHEITISVTVKNQGGCAAGPSTIEYYDGSTLISSDTVSRLAPDGGEEKKTFAWTPTTCGTHTIKAVADAKNEVHECIEDNNEKTESVEVDGPDLIIEEITVPDETICLDHEITISVTVKNQGGCAAGPSTIEYYDGSTLISSDTVSPLAKDGGEEKKTFAWTPTTCGSHTIKVVADAKNEVHECIEDNNEKTEIVEVDGPDLIIAEITVPDETICLDHEITISVTVKNQGGCAADPSTIEYYDGSTLISSDTVSSLAQDGGEEKKTFAWTPTTCGSHTIKAVADAKNEVHECIEDNNEKTESVEVDGPDLIIAEITVPDETICLDHEITISVTVKNQGGCAADPSTIEYYDGSTLISSDTVSSLAQDGGEEKKTFAWTPTTCGSHTIKAVADAKDEVHECVEDNNEKTVSVEVDGPDLIIAEIAVPAETICLDHEITISVTVKNQGGCAADPSTIEYYDGSALIFSDTVSSLAQDGGEEKKTFAWTPTTCGSHTIKAVADAKDEVHECVEDNNEKTVSVEVDGPDLIIQDISLPPGTICLNNPVSIEVTTANIGKCPATKQFTVMLYIDSKELTDTIEYLEDGNSIKSTFDWIPDACGNHNLKAVADPNGDIHECNEGNNENKKDIKVEGPDLIVKEISPASDLFIGVTTDINIVVENQGECRAIPFSINYSIDGAEESTIHVTSFLSPHTTETVHFSWTPNSCDRHQITAMADSFKFVPECDEDNNQKTQSVDVKGPDLIVEPITVSQPTTIGTPIKFTVVIRNKGTADAGSSYMRCYVDELPIGAKISVPAINRGQTSTHDVSWTASGCGPHTFKAVADVDLNVIECDEGNNDKQTSFTVKCPDLIIESITPSPGSPAPNQQVTFSVVVKNMGDADAKASHAKLVIDGSEVDTLPVGSIVAGSSVAKAFTWTASGCGDHDVKVIADCNGDVMESNEGNNEKTGSVSISCRPPTAYIDSITPNPATQGDDTVSFISHGTGSDGTIVAYNWRSSKDGQLSTSDLFTKSASKLTIGTHTIYFKVTDDNGMESPAVMAQLTIVSANQDPNANAHGPYSANKNEQVQFYGSGTDPDGDATTSYAWDFDNDGTTDSTQQNPIHSWSVAGTYYPTLKVKDNNGAWSEPDKCTVLISEASNYDGDIDGISSDTYYSVEKPVIIGVDIKNTGSIDETYKLDLVVYKSSKTISDETVDNILLSSGGTTFEKFSISGLSRGAYSFTLALNNLNYELYDSAQGSFKVIDETAIQIIEDDADSLKDAAIGELNQMVEIVTDTTHEMVMGAGWTLISGPIQDMLLGLFSSDTFVIEGITEQDVAGAGLEVSGIFEKIGGVVKEFENSFKLKQKLYNTFREGYTQQEENKIIQRDDSFGDFIENKPLERNDEIIRLFKLGESAVSSIVESRPWFVIGPFDSNGPLPGGEVSYEITLQEERTRYKDVRTVSGILGILAIIIAIIILIAGALVAVVGTGGTALAALPGIIVPLKAIVTGLTLLSNYALVALMLAMILTVPHIAPEVTQEHDTALDSIEDFISQQVTSAKVTSIKTMENSILFSQDAKLSIELNEKTSEKLIELVISPDGRVIDMNLRQPYNTQFITSSTKFPHQPGKYKMLAMTYDDMIESSIAEVEIEQVSPQISVNVYTDKTLYSSGETITIYANFTNPLNARVDNLIYCIDVSNTRNNKIGFLSLESELSKIETLNFVPANNGTYKATVTLLAGLYILDSAETGFIVESGKGISVNIDAKDIYDSNTNVAANLTIKNVGIGSYHGNIDVTTVDTLNNYQEVYNSTESLSVNTSEEKELQCIILPKENAVPSIYRCYINIDSSTYILPFTVSAKGTIFITALTSKLIYSASESVFVDISVKDVAFNAADAALQMTLTDPNGKNTDFAVMGSNGDYSTIITPDSKSVSGTYNILVNGTKEGYRVYSDKTFFIVDERTKLRCDIPRIIQLNTTDTINLFVETDTNQSVKDVFVTLTGCGFNETKTTDENGLVTFSMSSMSKTGRINVKIEKGGYGNFIGKMEIIGEEQNIFDTGPSTNPYPSINGTHNGTIKLNQTIELQKLYTYPCAGTGGHTEYARIWNATLNASAIWTGYEGDWHNITFDKAYTLAAGETYNYTICTGSYPQIHHTDNLTTANGYITCTEFIDANGKRNDTLGIPAIRLFP